MKSLYQKSTLLPLIFLLLGAFIIYSCRKDGSTETLDASTESDARLITDAKSYFEQSQSRLDSAKLHAMDAYNKTPMQRAAKTADWDKAYAATISIGRMVIVPVKFTGKQFIKVADYELPVSSLTRLFIYKNRKGVMRSEVVLRVPDLAYLQNSSKDKRFSGIVSVLDWQGNFIKAILFKPDGTTKHLGAPESITKNYSKYADSKYGTLSYDCIYYDWWVCVSADGGNSWSCNVTTEDRFCDDGDVTVDVDGPSDEDYGDGGGGGGGSSSGNPSTPPTPTDPSQCSSQMCRDTSVTNDPLLNCLFNLLDGHNHVFDSLAAGYKTSYNMDLRFTKSPNVATNAITDFTAMSMSNGHYSGVATVNLKSDYIRDNIGDSYIDVARTIFHETWHAELFQKVFSTYQLIDLYTIQQQHNGKPIGNMTTAELVDLLNVDQNGVLNNGGQPVQAINWNNLEQHNYMAKHVDILARGLGEFLSDINSPLANNQEFLYAEALSTLYEGSSYFSNHLSDYANKFPSLQSSTLTLPQLMANIRNINIPNTGTLPCQ